jgi:hypothetical protein
MWRHHTVQASQLLRCGRRPAVQQQRDQQAALQQWQQVESTRPSATAAHSLRRLPGLPAVALLPPARPVLQVHQWHSASLGRL